MKIYVTKYLFTEGIQEMEAEDGRMDGYARVNGGYLGFALYAQSDWHRTREAAVAHAEMLRIKKLATLDKQRKKIEAMSFA